MSWKKFRFQIVTRIFLILAFCAVSTYLLLTPFWHYGILTSFICLVFALFFLRFLEHSKKDLRQFLTSFEKGDFQDIGNTRLMPHSKDELSFAYHNLMQSLQSHLEEKSARLAELHNMMDQIQTGLLCFNQSWDIVFINRGAKSLLLNPYLKNLDGIARISPVLAENIINAEAGRVHTLSVDIEGEPCEFLMQAANFIQKDQTFRLIVLHQCTLLMRKRETTSADRLLSVMDKKIKNDPALLLKGIKQYVHIPKEETADTKIILLDIFNQACKRYQSRFHDRIHCHTSLSNTDLWVAGSPERMLQVMDILLDNALYALEEVDDPRIELVAELDLAGKVRLSIRDNGVGIDQEQLDWLFVPFFSTREGHAGLGLAMARKIIESMNGTIDVRSHKEKGTEFIIKF
jgi:two-component system nitrogen regulation sensor histidine kinase NtrY